MNNIDVLNALRCGSVSNNEVLSLATGFDDEINEFKILLKEVKNDQSIVKFLNGEYGAGKTFLLKLIEKLALEQNFVVSYIKFKPNYQDGGLKFFYRDLVNGLKTQNETSFEKIINNWIDTLKKNNGVDEYNDSDIEYFNHCFHNELSQLNGCTLSFKSALENYNKFRNFQEYDKSSSMLSWLSGDIVPFSENYEDFDVFGFLKSLSFLVKYINYSGLVILIDDIENVMSFEKHKQDYIYEYIKHVVDDSSLNNYKSTFIIFAGTPEWFESPKKGIPSFESLDDMIRTVLYNDSGQIRKPILNLKGFNENNIKEIAEKLITMHSEAYNWGASDKINPVLNDIISIHLDFACLTGGKVTPRIFIRSFISVLDAVQQNQSFFNNPQKIIRLFGERETHEVEDGFDFEDILEYDEKG